MPPLIFQSIQMFPYVFIPVSLVLATTSVCAQPNTDEYLRTAPQSTDLVEQSQLLTSWTPVGAPSNEVLVIIPSGTIYQTTVGTLPMLIAATGQTGTFALYLPLPLGPGYRYDLIVR